MRAVLVTALLLIAQPVWAHDPVELEAIPVPLEADGNNLIELITNKEAVIPSAVNNPMSFWNTSLNLIGSMDFGVETNYDAYNDDWFGSASVSVFDFDRDHTHMGSVRIGAGIRRQVYTAIRLNIPSIFANYMPNQVKDANTGFSNENWSTLGKLLNIQIGIGYQGEYQGNESRFLVPIGFGGTLTF